MKYYFLHFKTEVVWFVNYPNCRPERYYKYEEF